MIYFDGYCMVFKYLDDIYWKYKYDYLSALLGGMSILPDNSTADPSYQHDWDNAVKKALDASEDKNFTPDLAYRAAIIFLEDWLEIGYVEDIGKVYDDMKNRRYPDIWDNAVKEFEVPYLKLNTDR